MATSPKMDLSLVQDMVTNYKTKQYNSIVTNTVNPMPYDAQSSWFSLEALKTFISNLEKEVAKHPEYPVKNFGVRFYYAAYPPNTVWNTPGFEQLAGVDPLYAKLHTLIAVPTAQIDGINKDFDPYNVATYTGIKPMGKTATIMAENHGELIPPGSNAGAWF
ncbi:MAG: hypothetical protein QM710_02510 [Flavobacterium sp.]